MSLLISALTQPAILADFDQKKWRQILTEANTSELSARLYYLCQEYQINIPDYVDWHLASAFKIAEKQRRQAIREFHEVTKNLANIDANLTFLKGAAYIAQTLPCCFGRTFSDIDILVDKNVLFKVERILKLNNWHQSEIEDYDDKYYREWMHEIPPLYHGMRGTVLDVHHNILPLTNKDSPKPELFNYKTVETDNGLKVQILDNCDLLIHTSVHLFTESEFHHGLRDLSDIDMLIRHFTKIDQNYLNALVKRANNIGLSHYIWLALRYSQIVFQTPITEELLKSLNNKHGHFIGITLLDFCFTAIFKPNHSSCRTWKSTVANHILYWRSHLLKMPITILVPHLLKKSLMRIKDSFTKDEDNQLLP